VSEELKSVNAEEIGVWKMGVLPSLLSKYLPKYIFNAHECTLFFSLLHIKYKLSRMKAAMRATEVKTEILHLYVEIWMDLKTCHCWQLENQSSQGTSSM
jgi:hypothetical protein